MRSIVLVCSAARPAFVFAALLVLVAAVYSIVVLDVANAGYTPTYSVKYCNGLDTSFPVTKPYVDVDLAGTPACTGPGVVPALTPIDVMDRMTITSGDYMFGSPLFRFIDPGTTINTSLPVGEKVGGASMLYTLGLLNGPCTTPLNADVPLFNSEKSFGPVTPLAEGTADRFSNLVDDSAPSPSNSVALDELADSDSPLITGTVSMYDNFLDPDLEYPGGPNGPAPPVTPLARYSGAFKLPAGGEWHVMTVFQFDSGSLLPFSADPNNYLHPLGRAGTMSTSDKVMAIVFDDITQAIDTPTPISDICSPLQLDLMLLGTTPGGFDRMMTPTAGSVMVNEWSYSQRDLDGDGFENQYDTCPTLPNVGDVDGDGMDDACDVTSGIDGDGDGWQNRADNCPNVFNPGLAQINSEMLTAYAVAAADGGPRTDGIGDACDPDPTHANPPPYSYKELHNFAPVCIGLTDVDGDGYCSSVDPDDNDPGVTSFTQDSGGDTDFDHWGASREHYIGTDPSVGCGFTPGAPTQSETWPPDLVESNTITISDVLALLPVFNTTVPPTSPRFDLVPSGSITISDVLALLPVFNTICTP